MINDERIKAPLIISGPYLNLNFKCKAVKDKQKRIGIVAGYNWRLFAKSPSIKAIMLRCKPQPGQSK